MDSRYIIVYSNLVGFQYLTRTKKRVAPNVIFKTDFRVEETANNQVPTSLTSKFTHEYHSLNCTIFYNVTNDVYQTKSEPSIFSLIVCIRRINHEVVEQTRAFCPTDQIQFCKKFVSQINIFKIGSFFTKRSQEIDNRLIRIDLVC